MLSRHSSYVKSYVVFLFRNIANKKTSFMPKCCFIIADRQVSLSCLFKSKVLFLFNFMLSFSSSQKMSLLISFNVQCVCV